MSALMYGTSNFLAKPGQTLAPLLGTALISYLVGKSTHILALFCPTNNIL